LLSFSKTELVGGAEVDEVVTFDGYYGGLLNFNFTEGARRREMKLDYDRRLEKMIGMLGKRMLVLKAESVELMGGPFSSVISHNRGGSARR